MTPHTDVETLLLECRNARALLKELLDLRMLYLDDPALFSATVAKLARQYGWFAHSAVDALCLYFSREDADPVSGGAAIGHFTAALTALAKPRACTPLQEWVARHADRFTDGAPSPIAERNLKTVLRTVSALQPRDSHSAVAWWADLAKEFEGKWPFWLFLKGYEACRPDVRAAYARPIPI